MSKQSGKLVSKEEARKVFDEGGKIHYGKPNGVWIGMFGWDPAVKYDDDYLFKVVDNMHKGLLDWIEE